MPLELKAGLARAEVLPEMGGALACVEFSGRPVLRALSAEEGRGPFDVASIVLAPFSNRISRPFPWNGRTIAFERNLSSQAFAIHGDAFQKPWDVVEHNPAQVILHLANGAFGPLRYEARLAYAISPVGLDASLALTNRAVEPMPFGIGFHPWFPRDADTKLEFSAKSVWHEDERHLPVSERPAPVPAHWDFARPRQLPTGWINNAFDGWTGSARIIQGKGAASVTLAASSNLATLMVFSPGETSDFFCAEPVSHPVDAHNLPGMPGLKIPYWGSARITTVVN